MNSENSSASESQPSFAQRAVPVDPEQMGLNEFYQPDDQDGLSLDELSDVYANLVQSGESPYAPGGEEDVPPVEKADPIRDYPVTAGSGEDQAELTPKSILESMLFVGHPQGEPLSARDVAGMMRGVTTQEIHDLVVDLNITYTQQDTAFHIKSVDKGYVLALRDEFHTLHERFYGEVREKKLSQSAIDVLAIVAYNQGISREEIDTMRDRSSGSILSELVRREILRLERTDEKPRKSIYFTTDRFLNVFGLEHIDDLPQAMILDHEW
ncbi:MAG: SMC-Scp complex subunit ScpB [Planctomycetota bacterium]|nr:SMC-Scp complex subunit ScpB [Planctomycetota bacterium]